MNLIIGPDTTNALWMTQEMYKAFFFSSNRHNFLNIYADLYYATMHVFYLFNKYDLHWHVHELIYLFFFNKKRNVIKFLNRLKYLMNSMEIVFHWRRHILKSSLKWISQCKYCWQLSENAKCTKYKVSRALVYFSTVINCTQKLGRAIDRSW